MRRGSSLFLLAYAGLMGVACAKSPPEAHSAPAATRPRSRL